MQQQPGFPPTNIGGYPPSHSGGYNAPNSLIPGQMHNGASHVNYPGMAPPSAQITKPLAAPGHGPQASINGYGGGIPNGPQMGPPTSRFNPSPLTGHGHPSEMLPPPGPPASSQPPFSTPSIHSHTQPHFGNQPFYNQHPMSRAGGEPIRPLSSGSSMGPPVSQMQNMQLNNSRSGMMPPMSRGLPNSSLQPPSSMPSGQPMSSHSPMPNQSYPGDQPPMIQNQMPPRSMHGQSHMPGQPAFSVQQQIQGPPMPGQPPMQGGHAPIPDQQSMLGGQPPMPGQPPMIGGQPPMPGQPPMIGGQPPMPGQPPMIGGQPPMPGQPPMLGGPPGPGSMMGGPPHPSPQYPGQQPQTQQPRKLDPDAMPSPIQVIEDDRMNRSAEPFRTDGRGLVPPLVTTKFVAEDCGSASPRYVRCTTYNLPSTGDMAKGCQVPMALSIKPLAELPDGEAPPLLVDLGPEGPLRCKRCKAYMCPQFKFTDGGRRFQCVLCNAITDTPHHYFDHVDHMGQRVDKYRRPELCRGSYEFVTTKDYCRNDKFPNPPAFIFAIEVSYNAVKSGIVDMLCKELKTLLDHLPCDAGVQRSAVRVAFFTYNNTLHFYNLKSTLAQPQMMVVSDVADVFVPLQDGFLVNVEESRQVINSLLDQIPEMFADTRETEVVLGPVVQAGIQAFQSADCAGKLFIFNTALAGGDAPGKLKNRDDRKLIGTDKEKVLFSPAGNFYQKLAKDCVLQGCCVDLFLFPNQYVDVATIGQIAELTGGSIYKYNFFRPEVDGERFRQDLTHDIKRNIVFDAIMRVRSSTGIRAVNFAGAFYMSNTTDIELAAIDSDKAILVEMKHDDKINEEYGAYVQIALLYTSVSGQRRLRVHNLNLSVCTQLGDLYRSCETDVLTNYLAKTAVLAGLSQPGNKIREDMVTCVSTILACYRKHCASPSSAGQLILPECMKLLPVYLNCLLKNDAIHSSQEISTDDRAYLRQLLLTMDVAETQVFFYPRMLPVRSFSSSNLPKAIRCSEDRLNDTEVYLLENGLNLFLWIGSNVDSEWIRSVFGVQSAAQIDIDQGYLTPFDNPDSQQLRDLVALIQSQRIRHMKLTIIRQRDKLEPWFKHYLVEDRGFGGGASYVDFLCHMHKEIRALLT